MARGILRKLRTAMARMSERISAHDGSKYGAGLSTEGYAGGYLAALRDVEAALTHGCVSVENADLWCVDQGNSHSK